MTVELAVRDMTCEGCERIVESALTEVDGVEDAEADRTTGSATVEGDADADDLVQVVEMAGYGAST